MIFRKAAKEEFYKIRSLYWNLIDQEKDDPSFPHWKKGIHPSDEMIQNSIEREELYVLADGDEIAACVIANDEEVEGYIDVVKDMFERGIIKCRLSNLSITNCKRFKEKADFNFNFPLTVLVGQNGSGKTTVTRSIRLLKINYKPVCGEESEKHF